MMGPGIGSDPAFETQWFLLKPNRLPRGNKSIIMASVYHPPQNNIALKNYLFQSLDCALVKYPKAGIVILGDFNQFKPGNWTLSFNLKQVVNKPTRGNNILDKIYTTLPKYYCDVLVLPPIGLSDHSSILFCPAIQYSMSHSPVYTTKRDCRPANRRALSTTLAGMNWSPLYHTDSVDNQFALFSHLITSVMDIHLPLRTIKKHPNDKPWITTNIKRLITRATCGSTSLGLPFVLSIYRQRRKCANYPEAFG